MIVGANPCINPVGSVSEKSIALLALRFRVIFCARACISISSDMSDEPQYLTRNHEAIGNFLDTFDVSRQFILYRRVEDASGSIGRGRAR